MDNFGIMINTQKTSSRYRQGDQDEWDPTEAERIAYDLLHASNRNVSVTIGNDDHEFRLWHPDVSDFGNFSEPGGRWASWYVDAEINGHRWRYRPLAELRDWEDAAVAAEDLLELGNVVSMVWEGASDGSAEFEHPNETRG